jgi:hypothetical protein
MDWAGIVRRCPEFYPAILELGIRLLRQKGNRIAERMMERGFRMMLELRNPVPSEEDIEFIKRYFKPIMHKFIYKFGDVDQEMMENLFESLQIYYGFLVIRRIVDEAEFANLQNTIMRLKDELLDKMERYNAVRHDSTVSEKKKEKLREKLFEGDHTWPHI